MAEQQTDLTAVGRPAPLHDAVSRVTGRIQFAADVRVPGALVGRILFAGRPHARILGIDTTRAEALKGVHAVVTGRDAPRDRYFGLGGERWAIAHDEVRFGGDPVAAVAAEDAGTAAEALRLIAVEYEDLPVVDDPLESLRPDAPVVRSDRAWLYRAQHPELGPNVAARVELGYGDVEAGFAAADLVLEEEYRTQRVHHSYLEPRSVTAAVDPGGEVTIWTTTQGHHDCRQQVAHALDLPLHRIRVHAMAVGGGFGGKGDSLFEPIAVLLAQKAHRPVQLTLTRAEELIASQARIPTIIRIKSGVTREGRILARELDVVGDVGAAADSMITVFSADGLARGPYDIPNLRATWTDVYTNQIPASAFRAPRGPQVCFAVESHTDSLARRLGVEPLELRRRNAARPDDPKNPDFRETLERALSRAGWEERARGVDAQGRLIGWGIGCARWDIYNGGNSSAVVGINPDGSAVVNTGSVDISGSHTALAQIAAERLGIPLDRVVIVLGDTNLSPFADSTGGSRTVYNTGTAVLKACDDALAQLFETFSEETGVPVEEIELHEGGLRARSGQHWRSFGLLVRIRMDGGKGPTIGRGGQSKTPPCPVEVVQIAKVAVDPETGRVSLLRLVVAQSVGKAINPTSVEGQMAGAAAQGVGYALMEEALSRAGQVLNPSLLDYRLPTALDMPAVETVVVEGTPAAGPYGARGVGEPSIIPPAAAIANAVADAIGARIYRLPLTPEVVHAALRERAREQEAGR